MDITQEKCYTSRTGIITQGKYQFYTGLSGYYMVSAILYLVNKDFQ